MGQNDIANILNELGLDGDSPPPKPRIAAAPPPAHEIEIPERDAELTLDEIESSLAKAAEIGKPRIRAVAPDGGTLQPTPPPTTEPLADDAAGSGDNAGEARARRSGLTELYDPTEDSSGGGQDLESLLIDREIVRREAMTAARQVLKQSPGKRLTQVLIDQGADEVEVQRLEAEILGMPFERIDLEAGLDGGIEGTLLQRLGADFCKRRTAIPLRREGSRAVVGVTAPDDVTLLDELKQKLGVASVKLVLVTGGDVRAALERFTESTEEDVDLSEILSDVDEGDVEVAESSDDQAVDLEQQAGESPVIRYVNYIIHNAVKEGASDIHVEPAEKSIKVRFRIDGVLFEMMQPPASMSAAITSRLKIMANLDIAERRVPQDGRIRCTVQGRKLDLRVSTLPTPYGEKTVMRILDTRSINVELDQLGFSENTLEIWKRQVKNPHGIVLVTGPTGSGKTTTLYASLRQLDKQKLNISTVEDPVEYHLGGITQTQTHEKIGMTFAKALKALLRQDPDVIMLGEIRDHETAHTAIQAALTGHLVLSTLHTNDAPSSITRLVNIGLEPFLVGAAVNAVLAQRLTRKLCSHCKVQEPAEGELAEYMELQGLPTHEVWTPKGCEKCRDTGYSGRVGLYELLTVDDQLRDVIAGNPNVSEFRRMCIERGMVTLRADGMDKVRQGLTTVQEILRVTEAAV
ncbi:MAG: ATPase, T2SS/T4P/T4SS family [Planctomycetota bacterium]